MSTPNSSIETAMLGIRRTPEKLSESNLESEVRLESNFTINALHAASHSSTILRPEILSITAHVML